MGRNVKGRIIIGTNCMGRKVTGWTVGILLISVINATVWLQHLVVIISNILRFHRIANGVANSFVQIIQNPWILYETTDLVHDIRNLAQFYDAMKGLIHDVRKRKPIYETHRRFSAKTTKLLHCSLM